MTVSRQSAVNKKETQRKLDIQAAAASTHTPCQTYTLADRFEERAADQPDKTFLIYQDQSISYGELNRRANRVANAALAAGLHKGDVAALMMDFQR